MITTILTSSLTKKIKEELEREDSIEVSTTMEEMKINLVKIKNLITKKEPILEKRKIAKEKRADLEKLKE